MVAQGEALVEDQAKPWVCVWRKPKPRRGDRLSREGFCRPSRACSPFVLPTQGFAREALASPWANFGRPSGAEGKCP